MTALSHADIERIVHADHHDPFSVLGAHPLWLSGRQVLAVRTFQPHARSVDVLDAVTGGPLAETACLHPTGLFEAVLPDQPSPFPYLLRTTWADGSVSSTRDPYTFPPVLTDFDLHLFREGTHLEVYDKLGAHVRTVDGVRGVAFAVWAPGARRVSVVGDFNHWDGRRHAMRVRGESGVWEIFVPDLGDGVLYKFEVKGQDGRLRLKTDPYARRMELRPRTAAIVCTLEDGQWTDGAWMAARAKADPLTGPVSIYEVHLGSWRRVPEEGNRPLSYREAATRLVAYVKEMGYTHIQLLPVLEHPLDESWGYQVLGYFAPTSRFGPPADFQYFVNHCHENGIGVLLDWVPAHFPSDAHGLARFDGTALYEHEDPRQGSHPDWGTLIFNYGRTEVRNFLMANALFWLRKYHIDGLRVDAVASMLYLDYSRLDGQWVPNRYGGRENLEAIDFLKALNQAVYAQHPGILMIAEESTAWPGVSRPVYLGGLGFGFKWNMGWMNDTLRYVTKEPVHRKFHHDNLTFSMVYAFHENFILVLSHDEVVHGKGALLSKMPGDVWQKRANFRAFLGYMFGHPGKKLLFMGAEFGQWREWDAGGSLDWHLLPVEEHRQLQRYVRDLNALYRAEKALYERDYRPDGFEWIDFHDADHSIISFLRRDDSGGPPVVVACNFTPVPRLGYRIGVPEPGYYRELLNSDASVYGGSNVGNLGGVTTEPRPGHGRPFSIFISLPPLSTVIFKRQ